MDFTASYINPNSTKFTIYLFNIKLLSNKRSGPEVYRELIHALHEQKVAVNTYSDKSMQLRTQFGTNEKVIYGKIVYYTNLESDKVYNDQTNDIEPHQFDPNIHPNPKETSYFFVPEAHRFAIIANKGVSDTGVLKFLTQGLKQVIDWEEEIQVIIEQANDGYDMILSANEVKSIEINLTYSNNDKSDEFQELLDEDMKISNTEEMTIIAKGDNVNPIEIRKSNVLTGALKLSQSNGNAKATIIGGDNKKVKVETKDYSRKEIVDSPEGDEHNSVYNKIMGIFR